MSRSGKSWRRFFADLKRRGVVQTLGVYLVAAWATIEVTSTILPYLGFSDRAVTGVIVIAGIGLPIAVVLAWAFDLTPEGIQRADSDVVGQPVARTGLGRLPLAVGVVVLLLSASGIVWIRYFTPELRDLGSVAVFPFEIQGDTAVVGHLGDGMVSLLTEKFDGVAGLRATDPSMMLNRVGTDGPRLDPSSARSIAREMGATRFVMGAVTEVAGRIALSARLYEADASLEPSSASVEGSLSAVFRLAEDLVAQLLAQQVGAFSRQLTRSAARDTESLLAFKAFVDAERDLRRNRRDEAIAGFQRAIEEDGGFALAYYRLAVAASLRRNYVLAESSLEQALTYADRLGDRNRRLVAAFVSLQSGRIDEAEARYRALLEDYPDAWEARFFLGEMLTTHNPPRGRPASEGRPYLEEVTVVDPAFVCPTCTLANHALSRADIELADSIQRARYGDPPRFTTYWSASAAARDDSAAFDRIYQPGMNFFWQGPWIAAWFESYDWAERLVRPMTGGSRENELVRVHGAFILTDLLVARGRWTEVPDVLEVAAVIAPGRTLLRRAFYMTQPLARPAQAELEGMLSELEGWSGTDGDFADLESQMSPLLPLGRRYLLGLLEARRGASGAALAWADSLEVTPEPDDAQGMARDLALTVRADVALREGRPDDALRLLEGIRAQLPVEVMDLVETGPARQEIADLFTQEHARLLRIESLLDLGRALEARRWVENGFFRIGGNAILTPTLRKVEGDVYAALGETDLARDRYERFLVLWSSVEPEYQLHAEAVRQSLDALGGGGP